MSDKSDRKQKTLLEREWNCSFLLTLPRTDARACLCDRTPCSAGRSCFLFFPGEALARGRDCCVALLQD